MEYRPEEVEIAAYVIADNWLSDRSTFDQYRQAVGPTVLAYSGKYLIRGASAECVEGEWPYQGLVVIEFEDREKAREWYESPEYGAIKHLRQDSADSLLWIVNGV